MGVMKILMLLQKIFFGVLDVFLDFVTSINLISGQFRLGAYFASKTREEYDNAPDVDNLGWLVLAIPWLSGLARITFVGAGERWRGVHVKELVMRIAEYALALLAWPLFPNMV